MEGEFPYTKKEVQRIWDINYFANRNLASSITEFLSSNVLRSPSDLLSGFITISLKILLKIFPLRVFGREFIINIFSGIAKLPK